MKPASDTWPTEIASWLALARAGDEAARERLVRALYAELKRLAASALRRERTDHTLQTTALVHEAYVRLFGGAVPAFEDRAHFFGIAARVMRQVLVDHARRAAAGRRPPRQARIELSAAEDVTASALDGARLLDVHRALERLAELDDRQARIVELRFFGGLTAEETAAAVGISEATVAREWRAARAWLRSRLDEDAADRTARDERRGRGRLPPGPTA